MNYPKRGRPTWRKEDSDPEDDSQDSEGDSEVEQEFAALKGLLRELLDTCRKLSTLLTQSMPTLMQSEEPAT